MQVVIAGRDLPGRSYCGPNGNRLADVRVGVQVRSDPEQIVLLNRIDIALVGSAESQQRPLVARVHLSDDLRAPRCARVDPAAVEWSLG